jgi:hypothetical protein
MGIAPPAVALWLMPEHSDPLRAQAKRRQSRRSP